MSDDNPPEDYLESFPSPYRITSGDGTYVMNRNDLSWQFDAIDEYLSAFQGETRVELAEKGFLNYHEKGGIDSEDPVVVYAEPEQDLEKSRVQLDEQVSIVLGKRHSEAIPVEFRSGRNPFQSYRLYMPTHDAVDHELKSL